MSLVICSNIREDTLINRDANYEAAYSFHNALKQTLQIEPNSEVAVQSVKINKSANITLKKSDVWYEFFGKDLHLTQTSADAGPYRTIFCTPDLKGLDQKNVAMEEFSDIMERSINIGMPHPDIYGLLKFDILRQSISGVYIGFKITTNFLNLVPDIHLDATHFRNVSYWGLAHVNETAKVTVTAAAGGMTFTKNAGIVNAEEGCFQMVNGFPLTHQAGTLEYNVVGMRNAGGGTGTGYGSRPWQVGLCRSMLLDDTVSNVDADKGWVQYYDPIYTTTLGIGTNFQDNYYDVVVSCEQQAGAGNYKLKVHQATVNIAGGVSLEEVKYYGYVGALHANILDLSQTGPSGINLAKVKFTLRNEILNIFYENDAGTVIRICEFITDLAAGAKKENLICPMGQTRWNLYPKVCIIGSAAVPATANIVIEEYKANITTFNNWGQRNSDNNFYTRLESNNQVAILQDMDTRSIYDMTVDPTAVPVYTPAGIQTGIPTNKFLDRATQLIFAPSDTLYTHTQNANMAATLGFEQSPVLAPSINGVAVPLDTNQFTYSSDSTPELFSTASLFVRLDNFTQTSYNAGVGRPSKILYHLPRFDTSNRDLGTGLYFEPTEKTYVALGNSEKLYQNTIDISIANDNEQLATDLVGKTIVVLHIRKSQNRIKIEK
jgi:hypothetical protein